jgi:putative ABC transport system permease protein
MPDWRPHVRRVLGSDVSQSPQAEEIVAELVQHVDDRYRQSLAEGATAEEAHQRALDELSNAQSLIDEMTRPEPHRDRPIEPARGGGVVRGLVPEWRHAWRLLRRDPWFTAVAALTLAVGIGANGAIFSVVHAVLLRPLPYADPHELVMVWESRPREGVYDNVVSPADFLDWRARQQVFDDIAAHWSSSLTLTGRGEPERIGTGIASSSLFRVLGVAPALGRNFAADEEQAGRNQVVILTHGFWQRRFGGDPRIVGSRLTLDGQPSEVIGVLPASFRFPDETIDLWHPIDFTREDNRARFNHFLRVFARLKDGVTIDRAQQNMDAIAEQLHREVELQNQGHGAHIVPLRDQLVGDVRSALFVLMGAVACILLIACVNVANLLLVRGAARRKEVALRAALGAGRGRIVRQFVFECLTLAAMAAAIAVPITAWGTRVLQASVPIDVPRLNDAGLDLPVIGFMAGIAVVTAILFSLAPIWQVSRMNLARAINESGVHGGTSRKRARKTLVVAEIALAFVLLVAAGLMARTLVNLLTIDVGFVSSNVMTIPIAVPSADGATPQDRTARLGDVLERLRAQPGVHSAGYTSHVPVSGDDSRSGMAVEGRQPDPKEPTRAHWRVVTPGYFAAMQIRLVRGRFPTDTETQNLAPVAVINRTAAERYWPGVDPVGKRLRQLTPQWREIIGVVDDVRHWGAASPVNPEVYLPGLRNPTNLVVRSTQNPVALAATIREQVRAVSPSLPLAGMRTMDEIRGRSVASPRFYLFLLAIFGGVALVLAMLGVYGLVSYSVAQSRRDIGVRMALGARGPDVARVFLGEGLVLTLAGLALGAAGAFAVTRVLASLLFGVTATDTATFVAMAALLGLVAALASYLPARRSAAVDPLMALRSE